MAAQKKTSSSYQEEGVLAEPAYLYFTKVIQLFKMGCSCILKSNKLVNKGEQAQQKF